MTPAGKDQGLVAVAWRFRSKDGYGSWSWCGESPDYLHPEAYIVEPLVLADQAAARIAELEASEGRWIIRMSDVREAAGIGAKPMLSEVPEAIRARIAELEGMLEEADHALTLAANRLDYLALCFEEGSFSRNDAIKWTEDARSTLSSIQGR